jgi:hypothetical protein
MREPARPGLRGSLSQRMTRALSVILMCLRFAQTTIALPRNAFLSNRQNPSPPINVPTNTIQRKPLISAENEFVFPLELRNGIQRGNGMCKRNLKKHIPWETQGNPQVSTRTRETLPSNQLLWTSSIVCHDVHTQAGSPINHGQRFRRQRAHSEKGKSIPAKAQCTNQGFDPFGNLCRGPTTEICSRDDTRTCHVCKNSHKVEE